MFRKHVCLFFNTDSSQDSILFCWLFKKLNLNFIDISILCIFPLWKSELSPYVLVVSSTLPAPQFIPCLSSNRFGDVLVSFRSNKLWQLALAARTNVTLKRRLALAATPNKAGKPVTSPLSVLCVTDRQLSILDNITQDVTRIEIALFGNVAQDSWLKFLPLPLSFCFPSIYCSNSYTLLYKEALKHGSIIKCHIQEYFITFVLSE